MKKYLCMLAVVGLASSAFAQGKFTFTTGTGLVKAGNDAASATAIAKNGGYVQLLWAPNDAAFTAWQPGQTLAAWMTANPAWQTTEAKLINGPVAGKFTYTLEVPTATPGAEIDAVVAAWTGNAASFDAALQAAGTFAGFSSKFDINTANPADPLDIPGTTGGLVNVTALPAGTVVVPEPSTLTLAGLGVAALLAFRRRK